MIAAKSAVTYEEYYDFFKNHLKGIEINEES
jgi:hypothetical protein